MYRITSFGGVAALVLICVFVLDHRQTAVPEPVRTRSVQSRDTIMAYDGRALVLANLSSHRLWNFTLVCYQLAAVYNHAWPVRAQYPAFTVYYYGRLEPACKPGSGLIFEPTCAERVRAASLQPYNDIYSVYGYGDSAGVGSIHVREVELSQNPVSKTWSRVSEPRAFVLLPKRRRCHTAVHVPYEKVL